MVQYAYQKSRLALWGFLFLSFPYFFHCCLYNIFPSGEMCTTFLAYHCFAHQRNENITKEMEVVDVFISGKRRKEGSWPRLKINALFFDLHNQHKSIPFSNRQCPEEPIFWNSNIIYEPTFWIFILCFSVLYFWNILWKCKSNSAMLTNCK